MSRHRSHQHPAREQARVRGLAKFLGVFSIALGYVEMTRPGRIAETFGAEEHAKAARSVTRAYGVREIGAGLGLLAAKNPTPWLWARVAGDALDLASLAPALRGRQGESALAALLLVGGVTLLDIYTARAAQRAF